MAGGEGKRSGGAWSQGGEELEEGGEADGRGPHVNETEREVESWAGGGKERAGLGERERRRRAGLLGRGEKGAGLRFAGLGY